MYLRLFSLVPMFQPEPKGNWLYQRYGTRGIDGATQPKLLFAGRLLRASLALPTEPNISFESQLAGLSEGAVVDWC